MCYTVLIESPRDNFSLMRFKLESLFKVMLSELAWPDIKSLAGLRAAPLLAWPSQLTVTAIVITNVAQSFHKDCLMFFKT